MKILVVDDSPMQQKIARIYLEKGEGFSIVTADNGKLGIEAAKREKPDLILLDVEMPEMQGDEVLKVLKADAGTADIPVILCTSLSEEELDGRVDKNEIAGYLQKPHGFSTLKERIRDIFKHDNVI